MLRCNSEDGASSGPGSAVQEGDEVVAFMSREDMKAVIVKEKGSFGCRFGNYKMKDWIGKSSGRKVHAIDKGFVYLLSPTPELWTQVLKHRTQILYVADISLITTYLELRPGCRVLESGTGSGSLTHSLGRAVSPRGHVYTYEFHEERTKEAAKEFAVHRLEDNVSIQQRDIEANGFPEEHHGKADAVFLDLPGPWKVVDSAAKCLRGDGRICAFSPCIEQVQKTCGALSRAGFYNIRTMECLLRQYDLRTAPVVQDLLSASPLTAGQKRKRGIVPEGSQDTDSTYERSVLQVKPAAAARGHTGFLTFARRIVDDDDTVPELQPDLESQEEGSR